MEKRQEMASSVSCLVNLIGFHRRPDIWSSLLFLLSYEHDARDQRASTRASLQQRLHPAITVDGPFSFRAPREIALRAPLLQARRRDLLTVVNIGISGIERRRVVLRFFNSTEWNV